MPKRLYHKVYACRGNAMVLSVLMLLTLSSVGVISIQHTNTDLVIAGNLMRVARNEVIAEAATAMASANLSVSAGEVFMTPFDQQRRGPVREGNLSDPTINSAMLAGQFSYSTADPDPTNINDGTLYLPVVAPDGEEDKTPVLVDQGIAYQVDLLPLATRGTSIPGNEVQEICYLILDADSRGTTPTKFQSAELSLNGNVTFISARARVVAGPTRCP